MYVCVYLFIYIYVYRIGFCVCLGGRGGGGGEEAVRDHLPPITLIDWHTLLRLQYNIFNAGAMKLDDKYRIFQLYPLFERCKPGKGGGTRARRVHILQGQLLASYVDVHGIFCG